MGALKVSEQEKINHNRLSLRDKLKQWARELKSNVIALYFALKHPQTPLYAKVYIAIVVGYALSPIDLIPDFIPILGYLDEIILLPLFIALALKIMPSDVMQACRHKSITEPPAIKPKIRLAALVIAALWIFLFYLLYRSVK